MAVSVAAVAAVAVVVAVIASSGSGSGSTNGLPFQTANGMLSGHIPAASRGDSDEAAQGASPTGQ